MARRGITIEHAPRRRRLPGLKPTHCVCGHDLPCPVQTVLERQRFFERQARPEWDQPTASLRPLMTPHQERRSSQGCRR